MKFFNRARPIRPEDHYHLNPLERFDFEDFLFLIEDFFLSSLMVSQEPNGTDFCKNSDAQNAAG